MRMPTAVASRGVVGAEAAARREVDDVVPCRLGQSRVTCYKGGAATTAAAAMSRPPRRHVPRSSPSRLGQVDAARFAARPGVGVMHLPLAMVQWPPFQWLSSVGRAEIWSPRRSGSKSRLWRSTCGVWHLSTTAWRAREVIAVCVVPCARGEIESCGFVVLCATGAV